MREASHKPIEEHSSKYLTSTSQNCQGHQKQEKNDKLSHTVRYKMPKYNVS